MNHTRTDDGRRASEDESRPDTDAAAIEYDIRRRGRGRPRRDEAGEGQLDLLTGRTLKYAASEFVVEPDEFDEDDDLAAVTEAAIAALTLDAEFVVESASATVAHQIAAKQSHKGHWFSRFLTVGVSIHLREEEASTKQALEAHLLEIGGGTWHTQALTHFAKVHGFSRASLYRGSARLVELGLLTCIVRPGRASRYEVTEKLKQLAENASENQDPRHRDATPDIHDDLSGPASPRRGGRVTMTRHSRDREITTTREASADELYRAPGATCERCGGNVTRKLGSDEPNPLCKTCHYETLSETSGRSSSAAHVADPHLEVMRVLIGKGWGNPHATDPGPPDSKLAEFFEGDGAAVAAAKALRYQFGQLTDRDAAKVWRTTYDATREAFLRGERDPTDLDDASDGASEPVESVEYVDRSTRSFAALKPGRTEKTDR